MLSGLRATTSRLSLVDDRISDLFFLLAELSEVCSEGSKVRPFCTMVSSLVVNFDAFNNDAKKWEVLKKFILIFLEVQN